MAEYDEMVELLRQRAIARVALKKPSAIDQHDANLDSDAADAIQALQDENAKLKESLERCVLIAAASAGQS